MIQSLVYMSPALSSPRRIAGIVILIKVLQSLCVHRSNHTLCLKLDARQIMSCYQRHRVTLSQTTGTRVNIT